MFFILRHPGAGELLVAWQKYKATGAEELNLNEGDVVELLDTEDPTVSTAKRRKLDPDLEVETGSLLDSSAAKHKLSVKPKRSRHSSRYSPSRTPLNARWLVRRVKGDMRQGWVPCQVLQTLDEPQPGTGLPGDAAFRRQAVVKELVETEQEFVRDLDFVVQKYLIGSEREPRKPKIIKENFDLLFGNLKEISEFHRTVLMEGVKYYANEPHLLGKAFLRLERDFDKHVNYCKEEPLAQNFLDTCTTARDYFEELSHRLGDDKTISEHLKLPIQRINDYQLLLKELVRYSACLGEDNTDLQKALELMLSVPHRAQDDKFTNSIEGYRGSIHKLGRLLAHDWFSVCFGDITKERYLFLFKARVLISKVRRISDDRSVFQLKDIIKLPQVDVRDHPEDPLVFELLDRVAGHALTLTAHREDVKEFWLKEIREFATEAAEELTDDLQVVSQPASPPESSLQSQYQLPKAQTAEKLAEVAEKKVESKVEEKRVVQIEQKTSVKVEEKKSVKVEERQSVKVQEKKTETFVKVEEKTAKVDEKKAIVEAKVEEKKAIVEEKKAKVEEIKVDVKLEEKKSKVEEKKVDVKVEEKTAKVEEKKAEAKVEEKKAEAKVEEKKVAETKVEVKKDSKEAQKLEASKIPVAKTSTKVEATKPEATKANKVESTKAETTKVEAKTVEAPKVETTKVETPKVEAPKIEVPKVEAPKVEAIKVEPTKVEAKKVEAKKVEAIKSQPTPTTKVETNPTKEQTKPSTKSNPKVEANPSTKLETYPTTKPEASKVAKETTAAVETTTFEATKVETTKVEATKVEVAKVSKQSAKTEDKFPQPTPKKQKLTDPKLTESQVKISSSSQSATSHVINRELHEYGDSFRVEVDVNLEVERDGKSHVTDYGTTEEEMSSRRSLSTSSTTRYSALDSTNGRSRSIDTGRFNAETTGRYNAETTGRYGETTAGRYAETGRYTETTGRYGETGRYAETTASYRSSSLYDDSDSYSIRRRSEDHKMLKDEDRSDYGFSRRSIKEARSISRDEDHAARRRDLLRMSIDEEDTSILAKSSILSKIRDESKYSSMDDENDTSYRAKIRRNEDYDDRSYKRLSSNETSYSKYKDDDYDDRSYKRLYSKDDDNSYKSLDDTSSRSYKRDNSYISEDYHSLSSNKAKISSNVDVKEIRYKSLVDSEGKLTEDIKERSYKRLSSNDEENGYSLHNKNEERSYRRLSSKEGNGYKQISDTNEERSYKRLSSKDEDGSYRRNEERSYRRLSSKDEDTGHRRLSSTENNGEKSYSRLSSREESGRRRISIELSSSEDKSSSSLVEGEENRLAKFEKYSKRNENKIQSEESAGKIEEIRIKRQESKIRRQESNIQDEEYKISNTDFSSEECNVQIEESKERDVKKDVINENKKESRKIQKEESIEECAIKIEESEIKEDDKLKKKDKIKKEDKIKKQESKIIKEESLDKEIKDQVSESCIEETKAYKTKQTKEGSAYKEESAYREESNAYKEESGAYKEQSTAYKESGAYKEESGAYREESKTYSSKKSKVKSEELGGDSFQGVTQKTIFDHQVLEEVVKKSKSGHDIGMAPPDETPKFTKTVGGAHIKPGEGTVFEIKLEDTPDSLTWLRDNRIIDGDLARRIKVTSLDDHKTWRLEIFDAKDEDSGGFTAVAVNAKGKSTCTAHLVVHKLTEEEQLELKKPDFIIKLKDTDLLEDTYLRFMLKVKGDPAPTLTFFKDGKKIQDSDRIKVNRDHSDHDFYELVIPDVQSKDAGLYKCTATNEFGEASCEANVTVSSTKPLFEDLPEHQKDTLLPKGEKPSFLWRKDGQEFEAEERFKVLMGDDEDSLALIFQHVKPEDAGLYTCVAQTSTGHISCSAELTVQGTVHELYREPEKPQLIIEKREAITSVAASCMMELQVKGFPKPKVTWTHEGKVVEPSGKYKFLYEDEESMSLVIKNIEPADAGKYQITAENELGQDIREMELIVKMPPTIVKMVDTTASTEQELKMTAVIDGIPKPEVTFYKDGKVVKSSEHIKIVEEEKNYSILIKDTVLGDSGSYSVVASNEMAQVSQFWNLDVFCKPKILKKLGYDTSVYQKEEFEMSVQFESDPPPEVTWYKDDKEIKSDSHYVISKDGDTYKLKISGTVTTDSAQYKCRAKNIHGTVDDEMRIDVKRAPTITAELKDITATENDKNVTLALKVDSFPRPAVRWFLDELEITESRNEFTRTEDKDGASLIIKEANTTIAGRYTCRFSNELGECSSSCSLTVNCKPKIIKHLKDTTVEEGASLHLEVEVEAIPEPSVKWLRNGREVSSDARIKITRNKERYENYHLTVDLIKYEEQGEYEVQITNAHGTISSKSQVTVHKVIHTDAIEEFGEVVKIDLQEKKYGDEDARKIEVEGKEEAQRSKLGLSEGETIEIASVDSETPKIPGTEDIKAKKKKPKLGTSETIEIEDVETPKTPGTEDLSKDKQKKKAKLMETIEIEECDAGGSVTIEDVTEEPQSSFEKHQRKTEVFESTTIDVQDLSEDPQRSFEKMQKKTETFESSTFDVQEVEGPQGSSELMEKMRFQSVEIEELQFEVSTPEEAQSVIRKMQVESGIFEAQKVEGLSGEEPQTSKVLEKMRAESKTLEKQESQTQEASAVKALPQITSHNMKDTVQFASLATSFSVTSTGNPAPTAIWSLNGNPIKPDSNLRFKISEKDGVHKMDIVNLDPKDAGVYECSVTNCVGDVKHQAKLDITPEAELRRPKIRKDEHGLKDQTIVKKKSVTLQATIVGDPVPDITWLFNGKEITPEEFEEHKMVLETNDKEIEDGLKECVFTLTIPRCERVNGGKYTLKVKNKWGDVETSGVLTVVLTPEIIGPDYIKVVPGDSAELTCVIQSNPPPIVTWTKSENVIEPNANLKIIEDVEHEKYILKFEKTQLSDEGYYKVYAKNEYGESSSEGRVKVITDKPTFITGLGDAHVEDGGEVSLMVRADGLPLPDIQWLINGKLITDAPELQFHQTNERQCTSTLTITNFGSKDEGIYQVNAVNVVGDVETHAKVSMLQTPPTFIKKLERSEEVNEAEPLVLRAKVGGSPKPKVMWYKDGEKISPDNERIKTEHLPDGTVKLTIDSVTPIDSGAYKLVIKNKNGENAALCAVAVNAQPRRPKFTKLIKDTKVMLGEPLKLVAKVTAHPPPEVKWFKDGLPMRATSNVHLEHHPDGTVALVVDCVRPENAGKYSVVISNKLGEITGEAKVEIEKRPTRPEFVTKLFPQTVIEGFPVKFEVKAVGFPAPTITWTRNGAEVISDSKHIRVQDLPDGVSVLLIEACDEVRDAITYVATASNEAGEAVTSALLKVNPATRNDQPEERPSFLHDLRDVITDEGQALILEAPFTGNPIPSVEWLKDGQAIAASDRILLTCDGRKVGLKIDKALPTDAGVYTVAIINPLGSESTSAKASVHKVFQPAKFTQRFSDLQQLPTRDAKFPARVSGVPQPVVTWNKDGQPITKDTDKYRIKRDGDACCLYIMDCQEADNGIYTATAANKEGQDTCSAKLEVVKEIKVAKKIEPANFVKRIGDTDLYKGMTAKFTACAAGTPEPTVEWYRNDQRLYPSDRIRMECDTNGLLRLTIAGVDQDDLGKYTCKIHNEHGADSCDAQLRFDEGLESKKRPIQDQYEDYNKYKKSGAPMPLADAPIISRMTDRHCTISWKPSIPSGPRAPVTYQLEMLELPGGDWYTVRSGIRSAVCSVGNLEPFRDYKFRVRVENMYGISDPSPFAVTHREKLEPEPPKFMPYLPPGIDFRPETSPYFPKDFDIDRPPHDNVAQAPRFLRQEHDAQYGVKDQNTNLFWFVYGYPKPKMTYYFNDELIESGGRFDMSYTRNGQATLFINKMLDRDVGWYEAVATNEHGEARQRVRLEIAELPTFIRRPDIEYVMVRGKARFEARIAGVPYPEIKWYKDWKPLANSSRTKIQFMEPDTAILIINDSIFKDEGLYSVSARNVAGSISASAMLHVEENDLDYNIRTYTNPSPIKMKKKPYSDTYDIGDELGRGTSGITYHAAERLNGRNYAAKIMHGRGDFRPMMYNEWEMMNQLCHRRLISLHDAFEQEDQLTLVMELAAGGELVKDYLLKQEYYTESEIAGYIRQLLQGLQYMHERGIGHMGLNIGDLLLSHPGSDELKISDFGLSRRIQMGRLYPLKYGVPEYVSPECANGEGTGLGHDMWSVGIITYILLSGHSPYRGAHDMETLTRIQEGYKWQFEESYWSKLSLECRDFITKLLIYQAEGRMDVHTALRHPWLERADKIRTDEWRIETRYLKDYFMLYREWYDNASCRKWFRRRPLEGAFTHPSKMVYPPGERYTPPPSEPIAKTVRKPKTWEDQVPSRSPLNYEIGAFKSESHYQNGPDTYLLQLRDVEFPARLREYMKVAGSRGAGYAHIVSNENGYDWETPVIRERRRFTDIMDEEIDDERKTRISRYGSGDAGFMVRRLRHEIGTRLDTYAEAEAFLESKMEGRLPFFREKPQAAAMREGFDMELVCLAVGEPDPVVQWFKNDAILAESHRLKIEVDECGRSHLRMQPALSFDVGMYKVVARNKLGQTIARCRVVLGTVPDAPDSPEATQVSDTEALLQWKQPKHDGHSPIICYSVQYKLADDMEWSDRADNIDHEFYVMKNLIAGKNYIFRLAAKNLMGWSDYGVASPVIMTQPTGSPKVQISKAMSHLQQITDSGCEVVVDAGNVLDYTIESQPVEWIQGDPQEKYNFISEISRGRFSTVVKALDRSTDTVVVAKLIDGKAQGEDQLEGEFAALRSLRNERIATLIEAYKAPDGTSVFVLEKLQGADVLTYLASRHEYSEQTVATIVAQVLDGLQYLHWRGLCHLDVQPNNIVMCGVRSVQCKIVDLGCAHRVTKLGNKVPIVGHPDYIAPEVLHEEPAHPQTDIWSLGVLTYILLSGTLPFKGADDNESRQNILFVRYRFEHLYKEVSQEGVRFVMLLFKRQPVKRPTAEECHENRWLLPTDHMIKKRERAIFLGNRLKEYSESYHSEKSQQQTQLGAKVTRSHSMQEELDTAPF